MNGIVCNFFCQVFWLCLGMTLIFAVWCFTTYLYKKILLKLKYLSVPISRCCWEVSAVRFPLRHPKLRYPRNRAQVTKFYWSYVFVYFRIFCQTVSHIYDCFIELISNIFRFCYNLGFSSFYIGNRIFFSSCRCDIWNYFPQIFQVTLISIYHISRIVLFWFF